jgi:hypothetical protein
MLYLSKPGHFYHLQDNSFQWGRAPLGRADKVARLQFTGPGMVGGNVAVNR